jgi:hypothetical protein
MTLNTAIETAKQKAAGNAKWTRAIERAAAGLQSGELCVTLLHNGALVTSPRGSYFVTNHCECAAAQHGHVECVHRAAARITEMMEAEPETKPAPVRVPSRVYRGSWYGIRSGNAMWLNGWNI